MFAAVSHFPRVSEWVYLGTTAVNLAQVAAIEFGDKDKGADSYAIIRLAAYNADEEATGLGHTWFKVRDVAVVRQLREYVGQALIPAY